MIDEAKLFDATVSALRPHLGVAAEFVADDAMLALASDRSGSNMNDETRLRIFLIALSGLLPPHLDAEKIRHDILTGYQSPARAARSK